MGLFFLDFLSCLTCSSALLKCDQLQSAWRVLILDTESKVITCKKHVGLERLPAPVSSSKIVKLTQEQLLKGEGNLRRALPVSDIIQVHQYTGGDCSKILISFKIDSFASKQKSWSLEFAEADDHDDFVEQLKMLMDESFFFIRKQYNEDSDKQPIIFKFRPKGVPEELLPDFWQGVALRLAHDFDRTRTEVIRISRLKSLTDTELLQSLYDKVCK